MIPYEPLDEPFDVWWREPFAGLMSPPGTIDRLFPDSVLRSSSLAPFRHPFPIDVRETEQAYVVEASLPGIKPEEVQVRATEHAVTIQATRKQEEKPEQDQARGTDMSKDTGTSKQEGHFVRRERYEYAAGEVRRTMTFPSAIAPDQVTATYEQGVLTLHVPKTEAAKAKTIAIQVKESGKEPSTAQ